MPPAAVVKSGNLAAGFLGYLAAGLQFVALMKAPLHTRLCSIEMDESPVEGVAMDGNGGKSTSIEPLSKRSGDISFDATEGGAVPRVDILARRVLTSIGPIWVLTFKEPEVPQVEAQQI